MVDVSSKNMSFPEYEKERRKINPFAVISNTEPFMVIFLVDETRTNSSLIVGFC